MSERICVRCGKPATGDRGIWHADGEHPFCGTGPAPTCYTLALRDLMNTGLGARS